MNSLITALGQGWDNIVGVITGISVGDILDILILTFLIYKAIQLVRETHAGQLLKGIIVLALCSLAADLLDMTMVKLILHTVWEIGVIALIVLFQPELRHLLERLGKGALNKNIFRDLSQEDAEEHMIGTIDATVKACMAMSESKTGALIVWERTTILNDVVATGTPVDARITPELLGNLFYPKSPLHDGAVVVRGDRICSAACILPLTKNTDLNRELGTRHRSALGMSENSDAVVIVVSEETGTISLAIGGTLERNFDPITLKTRLVELIIGDAFEKKSDNPFKWLKRRVR